MNKATRTKIDALTTTSAKIRLMRKLHPELSQYKIAKELSIRPQHVNNVLKREVKNPKEVI